jgi:hypothetical protein
MVQWAMGTLMPGQVGREKVTVMVDPATDFGRLMKARAVLGSISQPDIIARANTVTKVVADTPFLLSIAVVPDPAEAGEQLDASVTITNTSTFDRSGVVLWFRYPAHLDDLHTNLLSDAGFSSAGYSCRSRYFVTWNLGTLPAGSAKTVILPPTVQAATVDGTIIDFDVIVEDATARSRTEHTVQIGQANESVFGTSILTKNVPDITIPTGSDAVVYGTAEPNHIIIGNGARAELINFPGQNTIEMQSDSSAFNVSRSGTVVTFTGSDGTILKIPATIEIQTISFNGDESRVLQIYNNQVKLDDQEITTTAAPIHGG